MLYERITSIALPDFLALQSSQTKINYQHMQDLQEGLRLAINKNFTDIKRMVSGALSVGNALKLSGATLSTYAMQILQDNDILIPSSKQVFQAIKIVMDAVDALDISVNDAIALLDGSVVKLTGNQTISDMKTFEDGITVDDVINMTGAFSRISTADGAPLMFGTDTFGAYLSMMGMPGAGYYEGVLMSAPAFAIQSEVTDIALISSGVVSILGTTEVSLGSPTGDVYLTSPLRSSTGLFKTEVPDGPFTGFIFETPEYIDGSAKLISIRNGTEEKLSLDKDGNLLVKGNVVSEGNSFIVNADNVQITDRVLELAKDNLLPLTGYAGIAIRNYDGINDGGMIIDNLGEFRVGDVTIEGDGTITDVDTVPLLARDEVLNLEDEDFMVWEAATKKAVGKKLSELLLTSTEEQAIEGINNDTYITPLRLAQAGGDFPYYGDTLNGGTFLGTEIDAVNGGTFTDTIVDLVIFGGYFIE